MANKIKFKGCDIEPLDSISKLSNRENIPYLFFDSDNITAFKANQGKKDSKPFYLFEFIQVMWGNDEIEEYILKGDEQIDLSQFGDVKEGIIKHLSIPYSYTLKKGLFSRYFYNVYFEYKNERYYLFVKTIAPRIDKIISSIREN